MQIMESLSFFSSGPGRSLHLQKKKDMVHLNNYKSAAQESHISVTCDGFFTTGIPEGSLEWLHPALQGVFNSLQKDFPSLEEIAVGGIISSSGDGQFSFRAFDIMLMLDYGSAYLSMSKARKMFSTFGIPYYGMLS